MTRARLSSAKFPFFCHPELARDLVSHFCHPEPARDLVILRPASIVIPFFHPASFCRDHPPSSIVPRRPRPPCLRPPPPPHSRWPRPTGNCIHQAIPSRPPLRQ